MNKVHLLRPTIDYAGRYTPRRTVCGMVGWRAKNSKTEYETEDGRRRFDAVERGDEIVDCRRCLSGTR